MNIHDAHPLRGMRPSFETKSPVAKPPKSDKCVDCGHGLHITAVRFSYLRAKAQFT